VDPTARNVTEGLRDAGVGVNYLLRDRDGKFGPGFDAVWRGEGASVLRSPVRAPNANAVAERFVRTVRSECTDRLLILNERHLRLRRVLDRYVRHYNGHRPHRGLALRPPLRLAASRPATIAIIRRQEVLGRLINEYHAA
jgi:putative transposase